MANKSEGVLCQDIGVRETVPVLYVRGSHYDVGFDAGRTFESMIKNFLSTYDRLHDFEKEYKTENGRLAYDKTLANMKKRYPYYVKEIQGIADGAKVPFYQIFLLHMDDIIETINENQIYRKDTGGCTSIGINSAKTSVLGHTEDTFLPSLNKFYILSAHIIPTPEDKADGAVEEHFSSLCYAGQMPGYTSGFNANGLVFSINTLSPRSLKPGGTPRTFITRALLTSKSLQEAEKILTDEGLGIGNGFSLNMIWTDKTGRRQMYNAEIAPDLKASKSLINIQKFEEDALIHCNKYQRLHVPEVRGPIIDSSLVRLGAIHKHAPPQQKKDVRDILSDTSTKDFRVYEIRNDARVVTICTGIFDLNEKTWSLYTNQANETEPIAVLPITFSKLNGN